MFRVLTVAREYGSGGGCIARAVAGQLKWDLLDKALVESIAREAHVAPQVAQEFDECVDSRLHRIGRRGLWYGAFEAVAALPETEFFDAETSASLERNVILDAYGKGNCVIVGRGGQCILQDRPDVLHVFIYAPLAERIARVRERRPESRDHERLIQSIDEARAAHVRTYYGCRWDDPHLYHMMLDSQLGEERLAGIIADAILGGPADGS